MESISLLLASLVLMGGLWTSEPTSTTPDSPRLPSIPVVKSWEDLLGQPPFNIGDGITIRLGIEATECPRWSGVLLYAYTEGYDDMQTKRTNRDRLGPAWVSTWFAGKSLDAERKYPSYPPGLLGEDKEPRLFVRPIVIDQPGEYRVTLRTEEGKEMATAAVKGMVDPEHPFHPWSPLLLLADAEHERIGEQYKLRRTAPARAINLGKGIGLPNIRGSAGFFRGGLPGPGVSPAQQLRWAQLESRCGKLPSRMVLPGKGPLPKLIPDGIDPKMELSLDPDKVVLRVVSQDELTTYRPDWHFLCRWWVNGKPFIPAQADSIPSLGGGATIYPDEDVLLQLQFNAKELGAGSGDEIELQLLYCPQSWLAVKNPQNIETSGSTEFPRLTNRVHFKVP
jgi:hypothetical protein